LKNLIFVCFLLVQLFDGWATFHGVSLFGTSIEGNPLLRFLMDRYDVLLVIVTGKAVAVGLGTVLHLYKRHKMLAASVLFYLVVAVLPWTYFLLKSS